MSAERVIRGRSIVEGCASGRLVALGRRAGETFRLSLDPSQVPDELERWRLAVESALADVETTRRHAVEVTGDEVGSIFHAQQLLLRDRDFQARVEERIASQRVNAEWALTQTVGHLLERFAALDSQTLRERADDLRDVCRSLLHALAGDAPDAVERIVGDDPRVVLAHDLTPSEAIRLSRAGVLGFGLEMGGQTSHTAIIARSLDLPLVAGLSQAVVAMPEAERAIIDGERGLVILEPSPATVERYRRRTLSAAERDAALERDGAGECFTTDGTQIHLLANIDLPDELADARRFGAEGIGLYRSEFLFIERSPNLPDEDEQLAVLEAMLAAAAPYPAVIRTFDLGGRKLAQEVIETHENNPVLGLRGIRLTLHRRDIFKSQVRAILRAGVHGRLRVLLPMVSTVDEIEEFRRFVDECAAELEAEGKPFVHNFSLGAMVEVPGAALIADRLARRVDFLSLGTNDLVQYALAVDRSNEHVAYLYQPLHPAILRMVRFVVDAGREAGIDVVVCGEVAADPRATALLLGLGLRHLSVTPRAIPAIKRRVRALGLDRLTAMAERCLEADSAGEVERIVRRAEDEEAATAPPGA
jgi:phosphoenolpyruvate-protein phosphotransferase (PTS system enzyme I)